MKLNKYKVLYWKLEQRIHLAYHQLLSLPTPKQYDSVEVTDAIVSLTSYPPRFHFLYENIKSLLRQSVRPKKIVLWVAFDDHKMLPKKLLQLEKAYASFHIISCEDTRSYKKIIPALEQFKDDNIVICDDDIIYPMHWLEQLYTAWNKKSNQVVAHRVHEIQMDADDKPKPYNQWTPHSQINMDSKLLFPTGMGGVLYPAGCFSSKVSDQALFQQLCPNADDIWLFWMAKMNHCDIRYSGKKINFIALPGTNAGGLAESNVYENGNDKQIENMLKFFGWCG